MTMPIPAAALGREPHVEVAADAAAELRSAASAACLFHALGERSRLVIVQHLLLGEHRVVDLTRHLGLAQSTVSRHLSCLLDCGLVRVRAEGRASVYSLAHPRATLQLLSAAEVLLAESGDAVTLCPTTGLTAREQS